LAEAAKSPHTSESLSQEISELTEEVEGLRAAYEQYFLGVERRPPTQRHDKLKKRVVAIQTSTVKQTAVKFKAQTLNNKLLTYERLWARTMKEIEDGTYKRDLFKAKMRRPDEPKAKAKEKPPEAKGPPPVETEDALDALGAPDPLDALDNVDVEEDDAPPTPPEANPLGSSGSAKPMPPPPSGKPSAPGAIPAPRISAPMPAPMARPSAPPPGPRPSAPVAASGGQLSEAKMRAIYDAYLMAKKRCNEDTSKITFESVSQTLKAQVPGLMKQHNAKSVEFKVVIKDGKAVLRALPKE
jgi:hypothetical protein